MTIETLSSLLGWCTIINIGVMLLWLAMLSFAHDWIYRMHCRWFKISKETFDATHYGGMAFYKLCIYLFNLVPWLALKIIA